MDSNGYYHLTLDTMKWQTPHRLSGHVYRDGRPMNVLKFGWGSNHYWIIGDDFGYFITNTGCSAPVLCIGTLTLVGPPLEFLP